jgi:broad specificity phosphatase PhoE
MLLHYRVKHDGVLPQVATREMKKVEYSSQPNGDTTLTENGLEQADLLGSYWAPRLEKHVQRGKLHAFVSPMQRNLETAHPLLTALGVKAQVRPDLCEIPLLAHSDDRPFFDSIMEKQARGVPAAELARLVKQRVAAGPWKPAGLSFRQMKKMFPWAEAQPDGDVPLQVLDTGFHTSAFETPTMATQRIGRVVDWMEALVASLPTDHVVLVVTHGDCMDRMVSRQSWLSSAAWCDNL